MQITYFHTHIYCSSFLVAWSLSRFPILCFPSFPKTTTTTMPVWLLAPGSERCTQKHINTVVLLLLLLPLLLLIVLLAPRQRRPRGYFPHMSPGGGWWAMGGFFCAWSTTFPPPTTTVLCVLMYSLTNGSNFRLHFFLFFFLDNFCGLTERSAGVRVRQGWLRDLHLAPGNSRRVVGSVGIGGYFFCSFDLRNEFTLLILCRWVMS